VRHVEIALAIAVVLILVALFLAVVDGDILTR